MKNASRALSLLLSLVMLFSMLPTNALAWKTKTHIYSSNLLLDENRHEGWQIPITLNDGRTLFFDMPQEYRDALITYPEMFRAGSMGPDVYPDMLTGQSWIHPDDVTLGITSGDWLKVLADAANALPKDSDRRKRAIAFTLGYMLHYCGDMFGHDFINIFAGGSFPSVATLADPGPRGIVLRHMATENYMDAAIDGSYKTDDRTLVYAPVDFLLNSMYYRGHASNGASDILRRFSNLPPQCSYLINLRNTLYQAAENMRKDYNPASVTAVAYLDRWIADIDDATYTLIMTFDNIGQRWARGTDGDVTVIQEELRKWLHNYGRYATPIPDVAFIPGNILDTILSYVKKIVPDFLLYFPNKWNEFLDYLTNSAIEYVMRAYVDMTPEELMDELKDPETLLNNSTDGLYNDMLAALGTFGHDAVGEGNAASKQTLAAFHNTITMMKLVLIGPSNYEILVHQLSGKAEHAYQPAEGQIKASGLNLRIQTSSDWRAGTDDNVYAVIEVREPNGSVRQFERLLDISGYDDFERRDLDTYEVPLGGLYCLSDIVSVSLQKRYREIADDWRLDTVDVIPMNGEVPLFGCDENSNDIGHHFDVYHTFTEKNEKRLLGNFSDLPTDLANIAASYKTEFSTGIIDFLNSLDMHRQWESDFELFDNHAMRTEAFYNIFHGFDPGLSMMLNEDPNDREHPAFTFLLEARKNGLGKELRARIGDILPPVDGEMVLYETDEFFNEKNDVEIGRETIQNGRAFVTVTKALSPNEPHYLRYRYTGSLNYAKLSKTFIYGYTTSVQSLTILDGYAEEGKSGEGNHAEGETVAISAGQREGYLFSHWSSVQGSWADIENTLAADTHILMPAEPLVLVANWTCDHHSNTNAVVCYEYTPCSVCGELLRTEHAFSDASPWYPLPDGQTHVQVCANAGCGYYKEDSRAPHGPWTADGVCETCGYACTHEDSEHDAPTCTQDASCTVCGKVFPAPGHDFGEHGAWVNTGDPDKHVKQCSRCDAVNPDISAPHSFSDDNLCIDCGYGCTHAGNTNEATCLDGADCSVCGTHLFDPLGHDFAGWLDTGAEGHVQVCSRCGTEEGHVQPHTLDDTAACTVCGHQSLVIVSQPEDQIVTVGETATFSLTVQGSRLAFSWYIDRGDGKGFVPVTANTRARILQTASYTTGATTAENDGYRYLCIVTDKVGNIATSDAATLHVAAYTEPPQTGDTAAPLRDLMRLLLGIAGLGLLGIKRRKKACK